MLTIRQPVDATDNCCKKHDECYSAAPPGCNCSTVQLIAHSARCTNWKQICSNVNLLSGIDQCTPHCCQCDFNGANCLLQNQKSKEDKLWRNWMDPNKGQCTQRCGKVPGCDCQPGGDNDSSICYCTHTLISIPI